MLNQFNIMLFLKLNKYPQRMTPLDFKNLLYIGHILTSKYYYYY